MYGELLKLDKAELLDLQKSLSNDLSTVDKAIEDILHVVEFFDMEDLSLEDLQNLKKLRKKRRDIKNDLQKIDSLLRSKPENKKQNLKNMTERHNKPVYHVKVLTDLYGQKLG